VLKLSYLKESFNQEMCLKCPLEKCTKQPIKVDSFGLACSNPLERTVFLLSKHAIENRIPLFKLMTNIARNYHLGKINSHFRHVEILRL
jgi:hypothetical protein